MSAFLLVVSLVLITYIIYIIEEKDLLSPPFVVSYMFMVSSIVTLANINIWSVNLHLRTIIVILMSVLFFWFGYSFSKAFKVKQNILITKYPLTENENYISLYIMLAFVMISIITAVLYYLEQFRLARILGTSNVYTNIFSAARHVSFSTDEKVSAPVQRLLLITKCIAYICTYILIKNITVKKYQVKYIMYALPLLIYGVTIFFSGGRETFIHLISYIIVLYSMLIYKYNGINFSVRQKIRKVFYRGSILFFVIFITMGMFIGKIKSENIYEKVSIYSGSSINALDIFLNNDIAEEDYFGQETLIPVYAALRSFGYEISSEYLYSPREFVWFNDEYSTNIYTALRRYIRDYGYIGCLIVMSIIGMLYGKFNKFVLSNNAGVYSIIMYAAIFFPLVEISIDERFFLRIISKGQLYECVILYLACRFLVKEFIPDKQNTSS